jgi:hypothetical protein
MLGFFLSKQQPIVKHLVAAEAAAGVQDPYIQYAKNQCAPDQPNVSTMTWTASDGDGSRKKNVVVAVVVSLSAVLLVGVGGFFLWKKLFRNKGESKPRPFFPNKGEVDDGLLLQIHVLI